MSKYSSPFLSEARLFFRYPPHTASLSIFFLGRPSRHPAGPRRPPSYIVHGARRRPFEHSIDTKPHRITAIQRFMLNSRLNTAAGEPCPIAFPGIQQTQKRPPGIQPARPSSRFLLQTSPSFLPVCFLHSVPCLSLVIPTLSRRYSPCLSIPVYILTGIYLSPKERYIP